MSATRPAERSERIGAPSPFGQLRALGRVRAEIEEANAPTVEVIDRQREAARARASLAGTVTRITSAFAVACMTHNAAPGTPCIGSERSRVVGFCGTRWSNATELAAREVGGWR